jgi:Phosphotransferase enzyme family
VADGKETSLPGGSITGATRVGRTVRRETGPWTPTIHALLRHLESVGFTGAPRVLGIDERGREILSLIDGESATHPWPAPLFTEEGMAALGRIIRAFHDAVRTFRPTDDALYRVGHKPLGPDMIVCHGDLGYWNTIWREGTVVGIIDWDFAEPDLPLRDIAQAAIYAVPLRDDKWWKEAGSSADPERRSRLAALCDGYGGVTPAAVIRAALDVQTQEIERLHTLGTAGVEPWKSFAERGQASWFQADADWIATYGADLA